MRLDLTEILQESGKHVDYPVNEPPMVDEDVECLRPVVGRLTFNNTGGTLLISGKVETHIALPCSRCAEYFEYPIALKVDEAFELRHSPGVRAGQTPTVVEEDENPDAGKLFDGSIFDLSELLRQSIMVEQPTQPLPPTDGEGKCAHCHRRPEEVMQEFGANDTVPLNPAFARLGELLKTDDNDSQ
jgi:uncharacterized protein